MIEIYDFAQLDTEKQNEVARLVSLSTIIDNENEHPLLVPVTMEEILEAMDARVALTAKNLFAGYIRAKDTLLDQNALAFRQIGTLTVIPEFRGNGVGVSLVKSITQLATQESIPFAFVNQSSEKTFALANYRRAESGELPASAVSKLGNQAMIYPN
ncbi:MAG: hypothetical protein JWN26_355 [Candidatus Saccharibacteria bacterium]|nr:hypothetical protein [Candidatus Saccharibacteria bacterium]